MHDRTIHIASRLDFLRISRALTPAVARSALSAAVSAALAVTPASPIVLGSILTACATSTVGTVTTITIPIASINAWGTAVIDGAELVSALPGVAGTPAGIAIAAIGPLATTALANLVAQAGTSQMLSFDSASVPAALSSLIADAETLLADATAAGASVPTTASNTIQTYIAAIKTIVALFQAALVATPPAATASAIQTTGGMPPAQALQVLHK